SLADLAIKEDGDSGQQEERTLEISPENAERDPCWHEFAKRNSRRDVGMEEIDGGEKDSSDGNPVAPDDAQASSRECPCAATEREIAEEDGPQEALSWAGDGVRK